MIYITCMCLLTTSTYVCQASCVHKQKTHGLQWARSIGMANKNALFCADFDGFIVLICCSDAQILKYGDFRADDRRQ